MKKREFYCSAVWARAKRLHERRNNTVESITYIKYRHRIEKYWIEMKTLDILLGLDSMRQDDNKSQK